MSAPGSLHDCARIQVMPSLDEHKRVGGPVGSMTALCFAWEQPGALALVEALGGWWAGELAASLPDVIEPGTSSHHRGPAHSVTLATLGGVTAFQSTRNLQSELRSAGRECFHAVQSSPSGLQRFALGAFGLMFHLAAGAVPAVPAGYLSHVALDAGTPRGVPLFVRGF